ncbi:MAG: calcium/sodium antiporter [Lachnospiraceae bacterium]|nr:calcium/sodium antiporter [Lachnospiraceae bacterium]
MIVPILLFIVGFICLIKGGDWFVDGAAGIAEKFRMPEILVGATVVSIGTTLPEVMVSASSALKGHGEIAYGNAIGSIICNTALIAALTIAFRPSKVERKSLVLPTFFFFTAAAFYCTVAYTAGYFSRVTGILLLLVFVVYMVISVRRALEAPPEEKPDAEGTGAAPEEKEAEAPAPLWKLLVMLVVGAALIAVGADLLVDNGTIIAEWIGVPESVIALTFVALGTSLPELVTAITSLRKGLGALSLGNVIGANLFNLVLVSGLSCTLSPFAVPVGKTFAGMPASFIIDIPLMFLVMAFVTVPALIKGRLYRIQGIVLLIVYFAFCIFQFAG